MRARGVAIVAAGLVGAWGAAVGVPWVRVALEDGGPSKSLGTVPQGHLEHGRPIRPCGPGYVAYAFLGAAIGRQCVNGAVRDALAASFAAARAREPRRTFVVGETGWEGRLRILRIDFEALAGLLPELQTQAASRALASQKISHPSTCRSFLATPVGRQLGPLADVLSRQPAWVRHDEHVHVDFVLGRAAATR